MTRHAKDFTAAARDRPNGPVTQARTSSSSLAGHTPPVDAVGRTLATTTSGLSADEADLRLDSNELQALDCTSPRHTLAAQFKVVWFV